MWMLLRILHRLQFKVLLYWQGPCFCVVWFVVRHIGLSWFADIRHVMVGIKI